MGTSYWRNSTQTKQRAPTRIAGHTQSAARGTPCSASRSGRSACFPNNAGTQVTTSHRPAARLKKQEALSTQAAEETPLTVTITLLARHALQQVPPAKLKISGANGDKRKSVVPALSHEQQGKAYPASLYKSYLKQTRYLAQPTTSNTPRRTCHSHRLSS